MFETIRRWRERRILDKSPIGAEEWSQAVAALPLLKGLSDDERERLIKLATLLIHYKSFEGAGGLALTRQMVMHIALQACLPILNLGLSAYDGWVSVIVYPAAFMAQRSFTDEAGVVHTGQAVNSGEAWQRGPVILGWHEVEDAAEIDGDNVVIHEFSHKLDMLNGAADGFPPMHSGMKAQEWAAAFGEAYEGFRHHCHSHHYHRIDCYAASSPAEFFAVFSEVFFERPSLLQHDYAEIYAQLCRYYRQEPAARLAKHSA